MYIILYMIITKTQKTSKRYPLSLANQGIFCGERTQLRLFLHQKDEVFALHRELDQIRRILVLRQPCRCRDARFPNAHER